MNSPVLNVGDPIPYFACASSKNSLFNFDTVAGRYIVLGFYGSAAIPKNVAIIHYITTELRPFFDDDNVAFFGVSIDPEDQQLFRVRQMLPVIRYFWDFERRISTL